MRKNHFCSSDQTMIDKIVYYLNNIKLKIQAPEREMEIYTWTLHMGIPGEGAVLDGLLSVLPPSVSVLQVIHVALGHEGEPRLPRPLLPRRRRLHRPPRRRRLAPETIFIYDH